MGGVLAASYRFAVHHEVFLKNCPKCGSVVKEWDVVCPVCGTTLINITEPKDSIKVKGNLPGWEDFKEKGKSKKEDDARAGEYDPKLVRAAIHSNYDEGKQLDRRALKALGHVSFLNESGSGEEIDDVDKVEEVDIRDIERPGTTDEFCSSDIMEMDNEESRPGQIVVKGRIRLEPKVEGASSGGTGQFPSFPPPGPSGKIVEKVPEKAPPPRAAAERRPIPQPGVVTSSQPVAGREPTVPSGAAPPSAGIAPAPQAAHRIRTVLKDTQPRQAKTTIPVGMSPVLGGKKTLPVSAQALAQQQAAHPTQPTPNIAGRPKRKKKVTSPSEAQQYDPETLKKIMQQAQTAAMMRGVRPEGETTRISLTLAILLIVMGTLSILGLAVIIFLLVSM